MRAAIQPSDEPGTVLAERFGDEEDQKTVRLRAKAIDPGDQLTCEAVFPTNAQTIYTEPRARHRFERRGEGASATVSRIAAIRRTGCRVRRRRKRSSGSFSRRTLTPAQEAVAVALRKALLISLDDLLAVVREFLNPNVSRSGLDRCLRR
jgi:hypothetical protein